MATEFSPDETFFEGTIDINLLTDENNPPNATEPSGKQKKTPRKSKTEESRTAKSTQKTKTPKENSNPVEEEPKKPGRTSKTKREPLKVLNNAEKPPQNCVTAARKNNSLKSNTTNESTQRGKPAGKSERGMPKIVVFEKGNNAKVQNKKKPTGGLSRSCDSTTANNRKSLPAGGKTETSEKEKVRYSVSDLSNEKSANKAKKSLKTTESKSPAKARSTEELHESFSENFSVEFFLAMFPNPWEHFSRKETHRSSSYVENSFHYLKNKHRKHYIQAIQEAMARNQNCLYLADKELSRKNRLLKMRTTNRSKLECDASRPMTFDPVFMQEVEFIENEKQIKSHLRKVEIARHKKFKETENAETPLECLSCNNFSLLRNDAVNCPAHHVFCKDCLIKYVKIEMRVDGIRFKCLVKCAETFSVDTLKGALSPPIVAGIIERNQREEIKPEGIENLVYCPFCYNVSMEPPESTVLKCTNPSCKMESCRKCRKASHVPWKCNEARQITGALSELEGEELKETKRESEESEHKEKGDTNDLSEKCSGEFLKREVSDETDQRFVATICSVCQQQPMCSHTDNQPCQQSSQSVSYSSDCTEYAEIEDDGNNSMAFL